LIGESPAILMKNNGVFTIGKTPEAATKAAIMVEDVAPTVIHTLYVMSRPRRLPAPTTTSRNKDSLT